MSRLNTIARAVSAATGVPVGKLLSERRDREYVRARHLAWLVTSDLTHKSTPNIARAWNRKDHTTIIHGINQARAYVAADPAFRAMYEAAKARAVAEISNSRQKQPETEAARVVRALVARYEAKLTGMAMQDAGRFIERFGNQVTA